MEQEIDFHREQMSTIDILANKLKSKVPRSSTFIVPIRNETAKRFEELQIDLEDKTARLKEATRGYMRVKKTFDELSSLLDDAEVTAENCSVLEADESFEELEVRDHITHTHSKDLLGLSSLFIAFPPDPFGVKYFVFTSIYETPQLVAQGLNRCFLFFVLHKL